MNMESEIQCDDTALKQKVQQYLDEYNIKHAQEGYHYLAAAISITCKNPQKAFSQIDLRNQVALLFGTRPENVERAVRYALRGTHMTNKQFIQNAADAIQQ